MNDFATKDFLFINLGMFFISTSGVLGRYLTLSPELIIFWRTSLATILLIGICKWSGVALFKNIKKDLGIFLIGGLLITVHWVAYFYALQWSSVAIGMLSLFTYPVITSILEPIILGTKFQKIHLLLGLLTLIGIYFLAPNLSLSDGNLPAIGMGTLSATAYALRNILMKKPIQRHDGTKLMFYHTLTAALLLSPFLFTKNSVPIPDQWWAILFLALFTTVIGHTLFLRSFKTFSITTASILSCTQPIYGIILGIIFLAEYPPWTTVIGGGLILMAVVIETKSFSR